MRERRDVWFASEGADLSGWLYLPDLEPSCAAVVMAHGFSGTRTGMTADRYAEVFCDRGLAVLLYDHLGFGDSDGEPRLQINPWLQARGYLDAISFISRLDEVDASRVGIWGDSLSGAVAVAVAGIDDRVAAMAVQVPALGAASVPDDPDGSLYRSFNRTVVSGEVRPSNGAGEGPMPVVSDDQVRHPSALTPLTAYRWFIEYGGRPGTGWVNEVTRAGPNTPAPWHAGLCAPHISCPTLFLVSPEDEMPAAVPAVAREVYQRIPAPKRWVDVSGGHFGLLYHPSAEFDEASAVQARFLAEALGVPARRGPQ